MALISALSKHKVAKTRILHSPRPSFPTPVPVCQCIVTLEPLEWFLCNMILKNFPKICGHILISAKIARHWWARYVKMVPRLTYSEQNPAYILYSIIFLSKLFNFINKKTILSGKLHYAYMFVCFSWRDSPFVCIFHSPVAGFSLLIQGFLITHNDAPQSVRLLWTSDQSVAETSTWPSQQTNIHAPSGIRTHILSGRAAVDLRLRPRGHWDRHYAYTHLTFFTARRFRKITKRD